MQDVDSDNPDDAGVNRRVTSSEDNASIIEMLLHNEVELLNIIRDEDDEGNFWIDDSDFLVREGEDLCDDLIYLGYLIGKSDYLKILSLTYMPVNNSFRDNIAVNKSIQTLYIQKDLGEEGFRRLAPFFRNTNTVKELKFTAPTISSESMKSIASLLSQGQIKSLKKVKFRDLDLEDKGYEDIARSLSMQPQLVELSLTDLIHEETGGCPGHITLGETMKQWRSPCLQALDFGIGHTLSHISDDCMLALKLYRLCFNQRNSPSIHLT